MFDLGTIWRKPPALNDARIMRADDELAVWDAASLSPFGIIAVILLVMLFTGNLHV